MSKIKQHYRTEDYKLLGYMIRMRNEKQKDYQKFIDSLG